MSNYNRDDMRREIREASWVGRQVGARAAAWVVAVVVFVGAISVGIWYFGVATSDVKGAGDATRITNDGQNRVNAQEWFQGQYELILSTDKKLDGHAKSLRDAKTPEDKAFWQGNLTGLQNRCHDMVAAYNAEANKVSRGKWRDASLPQRIDSNDPATDCQETALSSPAAR